MATKYKRLWCDYCERWVRGEKRMPNNIFHFIMIVLTFGLWAFVWSFAVLDLGVRSFQCPTCGGRRLKRWQPKHA